MPPESYLGVVSWTGYRPQFCGLLENRKQPEDSFVWIASPCPGGANFPWLELKWHGVALEIRPHRKINANSLANDGHQIGTLKHVRHQREERHLDGNMPSEALCR